MIIVLILILIPTIYAISFAKYSWDNKNMLAAIGILLISTISILLPLITLLLNI